MCRQKENTIIEKVPTYFVERVKGDQHHLLLSHAGTRLSTSSGGERWDFPELSSYAESLTG
jgi:hypothetical protein